MRLIACMLLLVALAGCLDGTGPAQEDAARAPGAAVPDELAGTLGLQGAECWENGVYYETSREAIAPYAPDNVTVRGETSAGLNLYVFSCASLVLDGGGFQKDANVLVHYLNIEGDGVTYYLLEAVTDWPPLREAFARQGAPAHEASFSRTGDAAAVQVRIEGDGLDYQIDIPLESPVLREKLDVDIPVLAGPGADVRMRLQIERHVGEPAPGPASLTATGGVLGDTARDARLTINIGAESDVRLHTY